MESNLDPSWLKQLKSELNQPYMHRLTRFLESQAAQGKTILPIKKNWFKAFNATPFEQVKVVIVGQDPYPTIGHAHGLAFSVLPNVKLPKSLVNIYTELKNDLGVDNFHTGYLMPWAQQGVLLLNSVLTVQAGTANSHQKQGWEQFTNAVLKSINDYHKNVVFILWGKYAQKKGAFIDTNKHFVIQSPHPSPLSCYRGFYGSQPFSKTNNYLQQMRKQTINWQLAQ